MMEDTARDLIRTRLGQAKAFLAQESPPRLSESDTKANFIEPVIAALGWEGIGVVTREYYVRNSQEFIDYVMSGPRGPLLAIEAKPLQADLTEKHAAQLIQYCAVEGIEWAALTNGRELQFFNTFLKPDLAAKRILRLDLLAFNTEAEFGLLFDQIWQLSRERMTQPTEVRTWLHQRRLDAALRDLLTNPGSAILRHVRRALADQDVNATSQEITHWFRTHLASGVATLPHALATAPPSAVMPTTPAGPGALRPIPTKAGAIAEAPEDQAPAERAGGAFAMRAVTEALRQRVQAEIPKTQWRETKYYAAAAADGETYLAYKVRSDRVIVGLALPIDFFHLAVQPDGDQFRWGRITNTVTLTSESDLNPTAMEVIRAAWQHATQGNYRHGVYFGVSLADLIVAHLLRPGQELVLIGPGQRVAAKATINADGQIDWQGKRFRSPSDRAFGALLGRRTTNLNGWTHWHANLDGELVPLATLRQRLMSRGEDAGAKAAPTATIA
jgi:hypothetical protein